MGIRIIDESREPLYNLSGINIDLARKTGGIDSTVSQGRRSGC